MDAKKGVIMFDKVEIAISTYNRSDIIKKWIELSIDELLEHNILLSVYDSSTNYETKGIIDKKNEEYKGKCEILYYKIDANMRLDDKVLFSILNSKREYVWPIGDSRLCDYASIKNKVCEAIVKDIDYIGLYGEAEELNGHIYDNIVEYFKEMFWCSTLLGGMIFKKKVFENLQDERIRSKYIKKYNKNDGFSYLGIFYEIALGYNCKGMYIFHSFSDIAISKKPGWIKRYFEVWCENMCYLFDLLPSDYQVIANETLLTTWKKIKLDGWYWLLRARIENGLNKNIFLKYEKNGMVYRVSTHTKRIRFVANMPVWFAKRCLYVYKIVKRCARLIRKR